MKEINGNILDIQKGIICHQTNCLGIMGGGLAKQMKDKYPDVYDNYHNYCKTFKNNLDKIFGTSYIYKINNDLTIASVFGQKEIGYKATDYDKTYTALLDLKNIIKKCKLENLNVYFPKFMGCGLGGGNWEIYSWILEKVFPNGIIVNYNGN